MESKRFFNVRRVLEKFENCDILFKDEHTGLFFTQRPYKIFAAEFTINMILDMEGTLSTFDYADTLGIDIPKELTDKYENSVFDISCLDEAWADGIHFDYDYMSGDCPENSYYILKLNVYPCDAYGECKGGCG